MKSTLLALVAVLCFTSAASAADISGKWVVDMSAAPAGAPGGGAPGAGGPGGGGGRGMGGGGTYEFKASGSTLTGSVTQMARGGGDPTVTQIADGKVTGDTFTFTVTRNMGGQEMKIVYNGKVVGDKLELSFDMMGRGPRTTTLKKAE